MSTKKRNKHVTLGEIKDIEYLYHFENLTAFETGKILGIKKSRVDSISRRYLENHRKIKKITLEEKKKIVEMFKKKHLHYATIARKVGRSKFTIRNILIKEVGSCDNKTFIFKNSNKIWNKAELDYLRKNYKEKTAKEIASTLKRTRAAVCTKIRKLRKKETIEYKSSGGHRNFRIVL